MPWETPTVAELRRINRDNIAAALPGADATVPNSVLRVLSDVNAAGAGLVLQYVDWLAQQLMPDTAESDWLDRHGQIWLGGRKAATYAAGTVLLTGTAGTVAPSGMRLTIGGVEYQTTESVTLALDEPTPVAVTARLSGSQGNQVEGTTAQVTSAISGIDGSATVEDIRGGADEESDDSLRERVLGRIRKPPMGGDADDYVAWALALPGVTRAWCAPNEMGPGTVTVRVMMDELRADVGGYPNTSDLDTIRAALDLVRPVALKDFFVQSPIAEPVNFVINDLERDTPAVRAAIEANVRAMLIERAAPARAENGVLLPAQTIHREWVSAAILATPLVDSFELVMDDHVMPNNGAIAVLGTALYG